ncbi:CDP-diacylglycerol---serine O-phosphatidyltransferase [Haladaptatus litoreus]|uniref:CDP-diacylglycerol---serine O-phosphatidyltransferase n=1 Tax=Haladaptatus litoreus TaxID=553468 RepID=A0A1N6Y7A6_9EURY|nr:protein sorting system archaetidylserine synthase [Haladaptatus litoreus]SIR10512.1 CDP-diacylglycerol---serine O-phosphatidyltransferase [Haladaptatus litoreus]
MQPRFVGRLSLADAVTVSNGALGFLAISVATTNPEMAARLVLLAAVADGLDGVLARHVGSSSAGPYLDSLADVASFAVAPAMLVVSMVRQTWAFDSLRVGIALLGGALFVGMAIVRLGLYTAYDTDDDVTEGVPTTLASVILAAGVLAGFTEPLVLVALTFVLAGLMVSTITYPDLLARDALIMGVVHSLAVLVPNLQGRAFPYALLTLALAYLVLSPHFYWRTTDRAPMGTTEGKRS